MIYNLFAYPASYGQLKIYKCDYYGTQKSLPRMCQVDDFSANIDQPVIDQELLFGSFNQQNTFKVGNRNIKISASFYFANEPSGLLHPSIDLLFNLSAWSYQGTHMPFKLSLEDLQTTYLIYKETLPIEALGIETANLGMFKFFLVNEIQNTEISPTSIDATTRTVVFNSTSAASDCWLEIFLYGDTDLLEGFPLAYEPMFRIDCTEGSFYPCMVDKISMSMNDDFVRLSCDFVALNFDRSTRYDFANAMSINNAFPIIKMLHRSRIRLKDYQNGLVADFGLTNYKNLATLDNLVTQSFDNTPVTSFGMNIDNKMEPFYGNTYGNTKRTFVFGYYSKGRTIGGDMTTLALRSAYPNFDRYPMLSGNGIPSLSVLFGNHIFTLPYTTWKPGSVKAREGNFVEMQFDYEALTDQRQGQPVHEMYGGLI